MKSRLFKVPIIIVGIIVSISFLTIHLTGDFHLFWAYGRLVSSSSLKGINALIEPWEVKGLLYRTIEYVEYVFTSSITNNDNLTWHVVYKFLGFALLSILSFAIVKTVPQRFKEGSSTASLFFIVIIGLLTVHFTTHLQAEMYGVAFLLLSLSIFLNGGLISGIVAAVIYSLTFYLKSPIPLLGGSLFFAVVLLEKKSFKKTIVSFVPFAITTVLFLGGTLLLIKMYYPQEIIDMWDASYYQHTMFHERNITQPLLNFIRGAGAHLFYSPIFALGVVTTLWLFVVMIKEHCFLLATSIVSIWLFPVAYIILSNTYFIYHYYLLTFPAIISNICFYIRFKTHINSYRIVLLAGFAFVFIYFVLILSSVAPTVLYSNDRYMCMLQSNREKGYPIGSKLGEGPVLFLDDGTGAFMFPNQSYLRYFYPNPLQRIGEGDEFRNSETYKTVKNRVMNYDGEYITVVDWFYKNGNEDIKEKIEKEYNLIETISYCDFPRSLFHRIFKEENMYIYKRKKI